jgi:zinc protease
MTRNQRTVAGGIPLVFERNDDVPLVHLGVNLRTGSALDPIGLEGMTRLLMRVVRLGTPELRGSQIEERIDSLGAHLSVSVGHSYVHVSATLIAQSLVPFVELLADLLLRPALRERDLVQARRETLAELSSLCDDDRALAARHYRRHALPDHPYGRSTAGNVRSVRALTAQQLRTHHRRLMVSGNLLFSAAGAFEERELAALLTRCFGPLKRGKPPPMRLSAPRMPRGRRILIVDKPERTQTQILIGTLGSHERDAEHVPLVVANTAFGGLFTARLTHEVRSKRGWSYGASSSLGHEQQRDLWSMWTFPAATDAIDCLRLQLELFETWVRDGLEDDELEKARSYLVKSHAFEIDTPSKRVEQLVDTKIFKLPADYYAGFSRAAGKVSRKSARLAVQRRLSTRDLAICLVATAKDVLPALQKLPGIDSVQIVPFDKL